MAISHRIDLFKPHYDNNDLNTVHDSLRGGGMG